MAQEQQPQLRRSSRISGQRIEFNQNVRRVSVNQKALPINHPPPWTLAELEGKYKVALQGMCRAYRIVEGHKWKKADLKKALYDYGQSAQVAVNSAEPSAPQSQRDPG